MCRRNATNRVCTGSGALQPLALLFKEGLSGVSRSFFLSLFLTPEEPWKTKVGAQQGFYSEWQFEQMISGSDTFSAVLLFQITK